MLVRRERLSTRNYLAGGSQNALVGADAIDGASTLVYVLGIGFMIYVGLEFVLPALFGATAKTKTAYRRLKSDGSESSSTFHRQATIAVPPTYQQHRDYSI